MKLVVLSVVVRVRNSVCMCLCTQWLTIAMTSLQQRWLLH